MAILLSDSMSDAPYCVVEPSGAFNEPYGFVVIKAYESHNDYVNNKTPLSKVAQLIPGDSSFPAPFNYSEDGLINYLEEYLIDNNPLYSGGTIVE